MPSAFEHPGPGRPASVAEPRGMSARRSRTLERRCRLSSVGQSDALVMRRSRVRFPEAAPLRQGPSECGPGVCPMWPRCRASSVPLIGFDAHPWWRHAVTLQWETVTLPKVDAIEEPEPPAGPSRRAVREWLDDRTLRSRQISPLLTALPLGLLGSVILFDIGALMSGNP